MPGVGNPGQPGTQLDSLAGRDMQKTDFYTRQRVRRALQALPWLDGAKPVRDRSARTSDLPIATVEVTGFRDER
jgi:hypothetical protein